VALAKEIVGIHPQTTHSNIYNYAQELHPRGLSAKEARMASWKEIDRFRKDPDRFRALAARLLVSFADLTDWERDFLYSIKMQRNLKDYTNRQAEKLLQIRDDNEKVTELSGCYSIKLILRQCYEARLDLSEEDEEWISHVFKEDPTSIKRKYAGRLLRCARQLGFIEDDYEKAA
jgi:hypothetical protein